MEPGIIFCKLLLKVSKTLELNSLIPASSVFRKASSSSFHHLTSQNQLAYAIQEKHVRIV
jgi:hypothetical protein